MTGSISADTKSRVLIVDDHPTVREGLATRIARLPDLEVCAEAADIPSALKAIEEQHPQIAVVDVSLEGGNGIDLIRRIRSRNQTMKILVWSMYPESLYAERALRAGANGYVTKGNATSRIVEAIRTIRDGKIFLSENATDRLLQRALSGISQQTSPVEMLSDRELEVFELIGQGLKTREVADRLHVSVHTIDTHRQRIREKLGLRNSAELSRAAVQWTLENG